KVVLDAIFTPQTFRNEVIWKRTSAHNDPKKFGRVHDTILVYAKSRDATWHPQFSDKGADYLKAHDFMREPDGRLYRLRDATAPAHGHTSGQFDWKGKHPPHGRMWAYTQENMRAMEAS